MVIVGARYEDGKLKLAQGYQHFGQVWSDIKLFDRQTLIDMLKAGKRVAFGRHLDLGSDFEVAGLLRLDGHEGQEVLVADGEGGDQDDLDVPLF